MSKITTTQREKLRHRILQLKLYELREAWAREISATILEHIKQSDTQTLRSVATQSGVPFSRLVNWLYNSPGSITAESAKKILHVLK